MITSRIQIFAIIAVKIFFAIIFLLMKKNRFEPRYTLLWIFSGFVMLLLALFPRLLDWFARLVGIYTPVNALFAAIIFIILMLMISFTSIISKEKQEIVRLIQELALLENRVQKMEEKTNSYRNEDHSDDER